MNDDDKRPVVVQRCADFGNAYMFSACSPGRWRTPIPDTQSPQNTVARSVAFVILR